MKTFNYQKIPSDHDNFDENCTNYEFSNHENVADDDNDDTYNESVDKLRYFNQRRRFHNFFMYLSYSMMIIVLLLVTNVYYNQFQVSFDYCIQDGYQNNNGNDSIDDGSSASITDVHRIILFGDSLIDVPSTEYQMHIDLLHRIQNKYPTLKFEILSSGMNGNYLLDLKKRLCDDVLLKHPEAVIMYWDSDVNRNSEYNYDSYKYNLIDMIKVLKKQVKYLAISGPCLIGELSNGSNKKDIDINRYRDINKTICREYNITYLDIREQFLIADELKGWNKTYGYLTFDGEHPTRVGSKIEEDLFYNQLEQWYKDV